MTTERKHHADVARAKLLRNAKGLRRSKGRVKEDIVQDSKALDRREQLTALRGLKGRVSFTLDLVRTRR